MSSPFDAQHGPADDEWSASGEQRPRQHADATGHALPPQGYAVAPRGYVPPPADNPITYGVAPRVGAPQPPAALPYADAHQPPAGLPYADAHQPPAGLPYADAHQPPAGLPYAGGHPYDGAGSGLTGQLYPAAPDQPKRRRGRFVAATVTALALAVGGGFAGAYGMSQVDHGNTSTTAGKATPVTTIANASTTSIANVVKTVDPSVVSLTVTGGRESDEGSGIVLRSDGVILTNNHVISAAENGGSITVTFTDGSTAPATIIAADTSEDLAVVKASGVTGLTAATLANSDNVAVGDSVVAIGNELGLSNSVSAGIISALHRKVSVASEQNTPFGNQGGDSGTTYPNAIQTDASINQGDSGGALFNMAGEVIGIDSAIATGSSGSTGSVGVGFAIAINDAKTFINANLPS